MDGSTFDVADKKANEEAARTQVVIANHMFKWRRAFERSELNEPYAALILVTVSKVVKVGNEADEDPEGIPERK